MATTAPPLWSRFTKSAFCSGKTSDWCRSAPIWSATDRLVISESPETRYTAMPLRFSSATRSMASVLMRSPKAATPRSSRFQARNATVWPCDSQCCARSSRSESTNTPWSSSNFLFPITMCFPSTRPVMPCPFRTSTEDASCSRAPSALARATSAFPSGCSEYCSTEAASERASLRTPAASRLVVIPDGCSCATQPSRRPA